MGRSELRSDCARHAYSLIIWADKSVNMALKLYVANSALLTCEKDKKLVKQATPVRRTRTYQRQYKTGRSIEHTYGG